MLNIMPQVYLYKTEYKSMHIIDLQGILEYKLQNIP